MKLISPSLLLVFSILSNHSFSQVVNDSCHTATEVYINSFGDFVCLTGSTKGATPDELPNYPCTISGFPTIWYKVVLDYYATFINLHVSTDVRQTAVIRVFSTLDECNQLQPISIGPNEETCLSGINGQLKLIGLENHGYLTYYIAVSTLNVAGAEFEMCVNSIEQDIACVREKDIDYENLSSSIRRKGPFHPGDEVQVCMNVPLYSGENTGCQWFQGLVPVFGAGWDYSSFDGNWQPENSSMNGNEIGQFGNGLYGTATWDWFTDVVYHGYHPYYQIGDLDTNGTVEMCSSLFDPYCPALGGVFGGCCSPCWDNPGDRLPPGWFAYGINGSCSVPGPPVGVDWGDGNTCGSSMGPWEFCFQLKVQEYPECSVYGNSLDLSLSFYSFADGETGAWTGGSAPCAFDQPAHLRLPALCFNNTSPPDTIEVIVCKGDSLILPLLDYTENDALINFWHLDEQYFPGIAPSTYLVPDDTLKFYFNNTSQVIQTRYLRVNGYQGEQTICSHLIFKVRIYPKIDASFNFLSNGLGVQFNSLIDVDGIYNWSFGDGNVSFEKDPYHIYQDESIYQVQLIIITLCGHDTSYLELNLITSPPLVSFTFSPQHICVGDSVIFVSDIIGQTDSIQWTFEGGMPNHVNTDTAIIFYGMAGLFDVMLTATNVIGSDTLLLSDAIQVDSPSELTYHVEVYDSLIVFTYTGSEVDSVYWDLGDGLIAHGITATKIYEGAGEYPVILYVKGVCGLDSIPFSVKIQTTSIVTSDFGSGYSLYPNPASKEVHIKRDADLGETIVEIYNVVGQQITRVNWPPAQPLLIIDLQRPGINPGTFYIIVKTGEGCFISPLIVQ